MYVKKSSYVGFVLVKFFLFYNIFFNIGGLLYRFILIIKCCYLVCFILLIKYVNLILDNCWKYRGIYVCIKLVLIVMMLCMKVYLIFISNVKEWNSLLWEGVM